jgi:hypothetical protein
MPAQRRFGRRAKSRDADDVLRAGALTALLAAAQNLRRERRTFFDDQCTRALRTTELVGRQRQVIGAE